MEEQIIYGRNAVTEALLAGKQADTVYVSKTAKGLGRIIELAKQNGAAVKDASPSKLDELCEGGKHGGVAALMSAAEYSSVDDIFKAAEEKNEPVFIVIADEIQDPHNLGAIIRTAEAAGVHGVIIPKRRGAGLTSVVYKTSAGAASWVKVARVSNLTETIKELKRRGVWVYGAEADGEPFREADLSGAVALVIGSEGNGLGRLVRENCDKILSIDMYGRINSLNASVSAGILIYEAVRNRRKNV